MKIKKYLEISLQQEEEVKEAIKYNEKNDYQYFIYYDNNYVDFELVKLLLRFDYEICKYHDKCLFKHKNYYYDKEKIEKGE